MTIQEQVEAAYAGTIEIADARDAVLETIDALDRGAVRVAEKLEDG